MIEKERQSELIRKFVVSQEMPDDEIANLSLDELTYVYFNTEIAKKDIRQSISRLSSRSFTGALSMRLRRQKRFTSHLPRNQSTRIWIQAGTYGCFQQKKI